MKLEAIAVFIIVLLLSIPLYSTSVYGDMISSTSAYGSDGVVGYRKLTDGTTFTAQVTGQNITADRVFIESIDGTYKEAFDICAQGTFGFDCVKVLEENTVDGGSYSYPIRLYDFPGGVIMSTVFSTIKTDDVAPEINTFVLNKYSFMSNESITISYSISDSAFSGCSGIDKVELHIGGVLFETYYVNSSSCNYNGEIVLNVGEFSPDEGENVLLLKAYDKMGLISDTKSISFDYDTTGPSIVAGSLNITDQNGDGFEYLPPRGLNTIITVEVDDEDFKSIKGKFIELNPTYYTYNEFVSGNCVEGVCEWVIFIDVPDTVTAVIYFEVEDNVGNVNSQSISYSLKMDKESPVITNVETNYGKYAGDVSDFTAIISESGSGFNDKNIRLSVSTINGMVLDADDCNSTAGGWRCYWNDVSANQDDGVRMVSILPTSQDDMGNLVSGVLDYNITLDVTIPELIEDISIIPIYGPVGMAVNLSQPKTGDSMHIVAKVDDFTPITATADFSEVLIDGGVETIPCVEGEDEWICDWETSEVIPGPDMGTIYFTFNDSAGHSLEVEEDIIIYGVDNVSQLEEMWRINNDYNEDRMPYKVDKELTTLVPYSVYFPIKLSKKYGYDTEIIEVFDLSCSNGTEYLGGVDVFGLVKSTFDEPYMEPSFYLKPSLVLGEYQEDISVVCEFSLISLYQGLGGIRLSSPETHSVEMEIEFDGIALGYLPDTVRGKLDDMESSGFVRGELLGPLEDVVKVFEDVCMLVGILNSIAVAVDIVAAIVSPTIPLGPALEGGAVGFTEGIIKITGDIDKYFCGFVNCKPWFFLQDDGGFWGGVGDVQNLASQWQTAGWFDGQEGETVEVKLRELSNSGPKKSLVLSVATFCLPGVINNLAKARQVECKYIYCMEKTVPLGTDVYACEYQRAFEWCQLVYGELFNLIPFVQFAQMLMNWFIAAFDNWLNLAIGIVSGVCMIDALLGSGAGAWCAKVQGGQMLWTALNTMIDFVDSGIGTIFDFGSGNYCHMIEEEGYLDDE